MTDKVSGKEVVELQELLMSQLIQLDAVTQLLIEKGLITEQEFIAKLKEVQGDYQKKNCA